MTQNLSPTVSIVLTTYNCAGFIEKTIDSLLNQTYKDFELIIVDDCSPDNTCELIGCYQDNRIKLVRNEINLGVSRSRNKGMNLAKGRYIAMSDHDDISLPERLEKQVYYLESHPDIVMLATEAEIYVHGKRYTLHQFQQWPPRLLHWILYFKSPIVHSSICFRKETLSQYAIEYHPGIKYADDYDLFHQFAHAGRIAILNAELVIKEEDGSNASFSHYEEMTQNGQSVLLEKYTQHLGLNVEQSDMCLLWHIFNEGKCAINEQELLRVGDLVQRATQAFTDRYQCNEVERQAIKLYNSELWLRAVAHFVKEHRNIKYLDYYKTYTDLSIVPINLVTKTKLILAFLIGKEKISQLKKIIYKLR